MDRTYWILGASALGMATGFASGYKLAQSKLETKYARIAQLEIEEAKKFYSKVYKKEDFATPEEAVDAVIGEAADALRKYQGDVEKVLDDLDVKGTVGVDTVLEVSEADGTIEENVFENKVEPDLHDLLDIDNRNPNLPYVISMEEYMENDPQHNQVTMTFYEGDRILADEKDDTVDDVANTVGVVNLMHFGLGSEDDNVVLVRNEKLTMDYEITKSTGKYAHEVLGLEEELRHSEPRRRGRRRWDDDDR